MLTAPTPQQERRDWILVIAWTLVIYVTIPLARLIQEVVAALWGRASFLVLVAGFVLASTALAVVYLRAARALRSRAQMVWLAGIALLYLVLTFRLRNNPEESLHFIQYGLLGLLAFRAFSHRLRDPLVYLCAALLCALLGTVDEWIQWAVPGRLFDFRDVRLNALAGSLIQPAIAFGLRPGYVITWPPGVAGVRTACRLAAVELLLLGLCVSNTPDRVESYAARVPGLAFLARNPSVMHEFGYRHEIPGTGIFFSRLTLEELATQDRQRAAEVSRILDDYYDNKRYQNDFLRLYTPGIDPFVHEARVHLFRRDEHTRRAREASSQPRAARAHYTTAWRENLFLESLFGRTLAASRYALPPDRRAELEGGNLPELRYVSTVSAQLTTRSTEAEIWAALVAGMVLLWLTSRWYAAGTETIRE